MPVSDRTKKLINMEKCRCRLNRVKRRNSRFVIGCCQRPVRLPLIAREVQADQPGQRVEQGEGQCADQQDGHEPEGPEKPWVTVGIVVRGVGQVACEAPIGPWVALAASFHHVVATQGRIGIRSRQDVVGPVTVIALGGTGRSEVRNLAVERVEEGPGFLLVALATLIHHGETEVIQIVARDGVGGMAGDAGRTLASFLQLITVFLRPVNARPEGLGDAMVALGAGLGHIIVVDGGGRVVGRQLTMGTVTVTASRRYQKSALQ